MLKAATTLQSAYERTDAALNLAAQRLETEYGQNFDPRLNPARLLRRIQALEEELPRLHEAAAANATAERELSHELHTQLVANHKATMGLAARAAVDVAASAERWEEARAGLALDERDGCFERVDEPSPEDDCCATGAAAAVPTPATAAPAEEVAAPRCLKAAAVGTAISETQWLRLEPKARAGHGLADLNEFWALLHGLFQRRQDPEVSAAQLLALGLRISAAENKAKLRLLELLGLVRLSNNAVALV